MGLGFGVGDIGTFLFGHLACDKISETFRAEFDHRATLPTYLTVGVLSTLSERCLPLFSCCNAVSHHSSRGTCGTPLTSFKRPATGAPSLETT